MNNYEYQRIGKLAEQLESANVDREKIDQIMEGGKDILKKARPEKKAEWMRGAMLKMNKLLDVQTRKTVREGCACCLGGKRLTISKAIAKENDTLEARIKAANEAKYIFGHSVKMMENGEIHVQFAPDGLESYRCYCIKSEKPLPITYCFCCGGHVKHHLQIALGKEMDCTTRSSALSSGGKFPCAFSFKLK